MRITANRNKVKHTGETKYMTINLHIPTRTEHLRPTITVVGVGGAGGNAVNNMIASHLEGVNFVVANTDAQALDQSLTERTIQLGASITKGLGAGATPDIGRAAAEESRDEIAAYVEGSNMVFITAGMGGGTGTGAAPVVARVAKELGILTVAVVTKPFQFEGNQRMRFAESGLKDLQDYVDTLIVIPNQNLFRIANERTSFSDAFKMADEVLHSGVRGVTDLIIKPGIINLDFADIRTVMREMGKAMMGTGEATGDRRAVEAAEAAISNPLLDDVSLKGARALLINITGGADMSLFEVDEAANRIREEVDQDANIIFGTTFNEAMEGRLRVSVVATGIDAQSFGNNTKANAAAADVRKPYGFGQQKPEPIKAPQRPSAFESAAPRPSFEPRQQPAPAAFEQAREEMMEAAPQPFIPDVRAVLREPASAPQTPEPVQQQPTLRATNPASASPRGTAQEPAVTRSFFQRMADAGRALSPARPDAEESREPRVQVVQKSLQLESADRGAKAADEDQYLDIPAFLRRQAN
jgi:cell division protein FtsZ